MEVETAGEADSGQSLGRRATAGDRARVVRLPGFEATPCEPWGSQATSFCDLLGNHVQDLRGSVVLPFDMSYTWRLDPWGSTGQETTSMIDRLFGPWDISSPGYQNGPFTVRLTITTYLGEISGEVTVESANFAIKNSAAAGIFNPMLGESAPLTISVGFATDVSVDVLTVANTNKSEVPTVI
ncbi:MAG: hypothetical protein HYX75_13150, partial [Acidobacteria bacterium]|nr:hypothetical protein [Acidobacteriota bacterium]